MRDAPEFYAIVPVPPPGPARNALLRDAIAVGGSEELLSKFFACETAEQQLVTQQSELAEFATRLADTGSHLVNQVEFFTAREVADARRDAKRKARRDAEKAEQSEREAQQRIQAELDALPDPDDPNPLEHVSPLGQQPAPDPMGIGDDGDLEVKNAPDPDKYGKDDVGTLPKELGTIGGSGTSLEPDFEALGKPKNPKQVQQPISSAVW